VQVLRPEHVGVEADDRLLPRGVRQGRLQGTDHRLCLDIEPIADPYDFFRVQKMAFAKVRDPETKKLVADRSRVVYNSHIELGGIPEAAYRYMLGSRSAIEWIIDRYQVKTDKASGIVNDPNDWSKEVSDPRYIIDLLARIVTVSLETMKIVDNLPALAIREDQNPS
jgi:predicted helicase